MSDEEFDAHYRELVDSFIDQANALTDKSHPENISLALLHAASRYNAFVVSTHAQNLQDYEKSMDQAKTYFISQYETMLDENLVDYRNVYSADTKYAHLIKR